MFSSLEQEGYNIFDLNDSFYNDFCSIYTTINNTDIILKDRKNDIYSKYGNISLCQSNCDFKYYNITNQKAKCECNIQENETNLNVFSIKFGKDEILNSFLDTLSNSNFQVLKCYKIAIDLKTLSENIGRIIMTIILLIIIIFLILFFILENKKIEIFINDIIKEKLDLENKNNKIKSSNNLKNKVFITQIDIKKSERSKNKNIKNDKKENIITSIFNVKNKKSKFNNNIKKKISKKNLKTYSDSENIKKNTKQVKITHIANPLKKYYNIHSENKIVYSNNEKTVSSKNNILFSKNSYINTENKNINKIKKNISINNSEKTIMNGKINNKISSENIKKKKVKIIGKNYTNEELNRMSYKEALIYDKRTYLQYYWALLKKKQLILFTIINRNDYNLITIKISLFFLSFSLYFTINGFFFNDDTMHKIYKDNGIYDIIYQIPIMIYSTLISSIINILLKTLSLSEKSILELKKEDKVKVIQEKSNLIRICMKIKFILFFILSVLLMIFFWYFISCFCGVYINTQKILINDTLISFGLSMLYPFGLNLLPGLSRIPALKAKKQDNECLYRTSNIIALI